MATTEITRRDVQQMPDDGRRRDTVEGELYVTVAADAGGDETGEIVGEIDWDEVFRSDV